MYSHKVTVYDLEKQDTPTSVALFLRAPNTEMQILGFRVAGICLRLKNIFLITTKMYLK